MVVHGRVENGVVVLDGGISLPDGTEVTVSYEIAKPPSCYLTLGKYPGDQSTLEDFRDAEWHGEKEFDDRHGP